ncbi:chemotaxis protein CheA [Paenibacillus mesotrionivorans]|uniref:Chemotaxis protein CheA n=1 Tax=Paenibacillus mesotrionivorans TaxID=3160968 RepID=A0ACC7NR45_9BACL
MELNQYLSMFIDESKDHLQAINENLLALEQSPEDISIVQVIFRSAHTLKGMSATMGFEDLAKLTHEMENVLDLVRNNKLSMNSFIFDCLFKSTDALETMVNDIIEGGTGQANVSDIVKALKSIVTGDYAKEPAASEAQPAEAGGGGSSAMQIDEFQYSVLEQSVSAGHNAYFIEVGVREDCVLKAARAYMVFDIFEQNGEVIKSVPSIQDIEQEKFDRVFSVFYVTQLPQAELDKMIGNVSEIDSVKSVLFDQESLKELKEQKQEKPAAPAPAASEAPTAGQAPNAREATPAPQAPAAAKTGHQPVANRTIRVDIDRLDMLMNLFSEMLIDRVRLEQLASEIRRQELTETVEHMARVSSDLQNIVLKLRMVPVDTVFNRFPRMVRDVAKSLNKKVDLVVTGADTELDRTVVDEIGDPLVHLLRNSIDHGVEPIDDRVATGKSETGTVWLRAFHSGNHVFIEIEDDGRGINRQKVLQTAIKKGIVREEQAERMTDDEVAALLFASGFSTADKISDISGRGVGLDVVKTKIESLGGVVAVESKPGKGTKFSVQLPLTLSIISAMLIRVNDEKYAIPLSSIVETAVIRKSSIRNVQGVPLLDYRNSVIPLVSLAQIYQVPDNGQPERDETEIVIIKKGEKMAALSVSELIGQQEIVLKNLGKYLNNVFAVSGATILGDGQVALIMDTNALIK